MRTPRRLRTAWTTLTGTGAAASVAFGLLVFAAVLASLAIPRESTGLRTEALQRMVASSPLGDRTVTGTIGLADTNSQEMAAQITAIGTRLQSRVAATGLPVASDPPAWSGLTSGYAPVTGAAAAGRGQPQFELAYRSALARYSHLVAGRLPSGVTPPGAAVPAAVTTATAARFGLRVGARLSMGPEVQLVITGIIRPLHPASAFWTEDPGATRPQLIPGTSSQPAHWAGAVFIDGGALPLVESSLNAGLMLLTWVIPADFGRLTADQAAAVRTGVSGLVDSGLVLAPGTSGPGSPAPVHATCPELRCPPPPSSTPPITVSISSQIPTILGPFIAADNAVAPVLGLLYVGLAIMGGVVILLGARLVAQHRAAEFTLMRARGAALYQLAWLVLRASTVIAVAAGAAAAALALGLTPGGGNRVTWWLAGVTIVVTLAGPVLISVVPHRVAAPATGRPGGRASARKPAARRVVLEAALVAAAIGGLIVLRHQGLSGGNSALYPSAAPVLVAIPVAVIVLRCYPPAARGLARLAGRSRGVVAFVGLARATRTPPGAALPAFALVLVLAMVAFPAMISTSVTQGQVAESWRQVGADVIIEARDGLAIPPGLQGQIASMPGVTSTATGVIEYAVLPSGQELTAVFVNPARYAAVTDQAPGSPFPLAALSGTGATVPAVATSAAAQLAGAGAGAAQPGRHPDHHDPGDRADRRRPRPRRHHRHGGAPAGARVSLARAGPAAGGRFRAGCGAGARGCRPRDARRVGRIPRRGPGRDDRSAGITGGADGPHAGDSRGGRVRRAGPAAVAGTRRANPGHDAVAAVHDGAAALAGSALAGGRDASPGGGGRHRGRCLRLATGPPGRAVDTPGRIHRGRPGRRGGSRPAAAGRLGRRADTGLAARPGGPGRGHLPPRQRPGAADH